MSLLSKEDMQYVRGGDVFTQARNTHMEQFVKRYYMCSKEERLPYYMHQAPTGRKVIAGCPRKLEGVFQACIQAKERPDGNSYYYGHTMYPDECSPTLWTEIKISYRKIKKYLKDKMC